MNGNVTFDEAVGINGSLEFYFMVTNDGKGCRCVAMSPTKEIGGCMTDYDWNSVEIDEQTIDRIMGLIL